MPRVARELWSESLRRTRNATMSRLASLFGARELTAAYWEDLETALIQADLGPKACRSLIDGLKRAASESAVLRADALRSALRQSMLELVSWADVAPTPDDSRPHVVLVVGVNGTGKTTSVARLARLHQRFGRKVLLGAADTFRAAADEQLARWVERLETEMVAGAPGSDPGAVVYQASEAALSGAYDVLIIDTSGRMHTSHNLMAELEKLHRVAAKVIQGAPDEVLLVIDGTTGQNGLAQARAFTGAVGVTGVILAKLDSSARGGVGLAISSELGLPIRYVGLGEGLDDLLPFDPERYVDGLLPELSPAGL